jgi:hypothetical protein
MTETLTGPSGRTIMAGGVAVGAIQTLIGMLFLGDDDDEFGKAWGELPSFVRERNFVIPIPGTPNYFTVPMPLGYHIFPNLGRIMVEAALGTSGKSETETMADMALIVADAFNPLGGSESWWHMMTPTPFDPIVAIGINQDWTGRPISRENFNGLDPEPGHALAKDSSSPWARAMALGINAGTGGTDYVPGWASPTPDQIDYLFGQLTGGVGREITKAGTTLAAPFTEDPLPPYKVPLIGRFYGTTTGPGSESDAFYKNVRKLNAVQSELEGRLQDGKDVRDLYEKEPLVNLAAMGEGTHRSVSKLRRERRAIAEAKLPGWRDHVKLLDEQIQMEMGHLNQMVRQARAQ